MTKKLSLGSMFLICQLIIIFYYSIGSQYVNFNEDYIVRVTKYGKKIVCFNVSFPRINYTTYSWQTIIPSKSFVYSAFFDTRDQNPEIKIMTVIDKSYHGNSNFTCNIWEKEGSHPHITSAILVKKLGSGNFR